MIHMGNDAEVPDTLQWKICHVDFLKNKHLLTIQELMTTGVFCLIIFNDAASNSNMVSFIIVTETSNSNMVSFIIVTETLDDWTDIYWTLTTVKKVYK